MIAYSKKAAIESRCFDRVVVSTDVDEIAETAIEHGAEIPFLRPHILSDDTASTHDVVKHGVRELGKGGCAGEYVCYLYATALFTTTDDIVRSLRKLLLGGHENFVFGATTYGFPIQRAFRLNQENVAEAIDPISMEMRSQDLEDAYHDAGQFYWAKAKTWLEDVNPFDGGMPYMIDRWRAQHIDTEADWRYAELLYSIDRVSKE